MKKQTDFDDEYKQALLYARKEKYDEYLAIIRKLAGKGYKPAQMCLGVAYFQGLGSLQKDYTESLKWHMKAVSDELPENYYWISLLYDPALDENCGVTFKSKSKSDEYLIKAVEAMERKALDGDVQAMHRVGELCSIFGSVVYDQNKAEHWFDEWRKSDQSSIK